MKKLSLILSLLLCVGLLAGCAGTPVIYYTECTCPAGEAAAPAETQAAQQTPAETVDQAPVAEGTVKTGLAIVTGIADSASAEGETMGEAKYDVTMVAVLVDDNGIIQDCIIDGITTSVKFDAAGAITTELTSGPKTKNELGPDYNMVAFGGAIAEWDQQAAALASYAVGKTVEELKTMAISESGYAAEGTDLAASATIYLGGYVSAIEKAVENAAHLGAMAGDELKLAAITGIDGSKSASEEGDGVAQLDATVTALTMQGDIITSCAIDAVQAKVGFDTAGVVTSDLAAPVLTKNELGPDYNMVAYGGAIAEWDQQAASFAAYITGKTLDQVKGIAIDAATKPTDADLAASVTISIGSFQALIEKAVQ